jgi:Leucine-rich repeat (LRR) protein
MDENASICTWWGVRCSSDGMVIGMSLRSNNLVGTFPSRKVFEDIPTLESLILDGNTIHFPFAGIASATSLITLDLSHMELNSVAGVELAPNLKNLYVSSNNLRGAFPTEILQMQSLERVAVAFNALTGTIPEELSLLTALEFIALHDNDIHGTIPSTLGDLSDLAFLLLHGNELHGSIPTQLNFLTKLNLLDLSNQEGQGLMGALPSFAAIPTIKRIDLSDNSLTGAIPEDFLDSANAAGFDHIDLSFNKLTGELPRVFAKFPVSSYEVTQNRISSLSQELCDQSLGGSVASYGCDAVLCRPGTFNSKGRQLSDDEPCDPCQENQYFGSVRCGDSPLSPPTGPPAQSDFGDAEILGVFYDSLNGDHWTRRDHWKDTSISVCEWFGVRCATDGIERVEYLTLSSNKLVGTTPSEIFQLPFLKSLVLDSNEIEFSFSGIENAISLETLDLSNTGLSSIDGVENAKQLKEFHFASNTVVGEFPEALCEMTTLEQLHFDFNSISGPLPECIGRLSNLKLLSCEKNQLTGELPVDMESLVNLVTLRLGRNLFSGEVPSTLNEMTSLAFIDISRQTDRGGPGLFGPLPVFDGMSQLRSLNLKGNSISGSIPENFLKDVNLDTFEMADLSSNSITGTLPPSLMALGNNVYLQDNKISGIAIELCDEGRGPLFAAYGCDAILCPPKSSSPHGRQESDAITCDPCPEAQYFGSTVCPGSNPTPSPPTGTVNLYPTDPSMERQILIDFYNSCGGDNWDARENWLSSVESICTWDGIVCGGDGSETVIAIEFGANNVVGVPPSELFSLPNLRTLSLYSNPIDGFNFEGIENANSLQELLLDATGISSIKGIGDAPSLTTVNLRFNNLQGSFPSEIARLSKLHTITMAYNDLTGTLPAFLEDLIQLRTLLLSNNHLTGSLHGVNFPSSIRLLDLSENSVSGSIPNSFMTLVPFSAELEVDLSNNLLTGSIPIDLTRFDRLNIYLKGNQITGMDQQLCEKTFWNDGDVGDYGCNGLLCPAGFYAPTGRHSGSGACMDCDGAIYLGTASCEASPADRVAIVWSVFVLAVVATTILFGI